MLPKDWLPTLGLVVSAFLGIATYYLQERAKRKTALAERKQGLYEQLIRNLVDLLVAKTGAERSKLITEIEKGWLFASDEVLSACYGFLEAYNALCCPDEQQGCSTFREVLPILRSDLEARQEMGKSFAAIFMIMRRDIRSDTTFTDQWAKQHLRIYPWGILAESDAPAVG